MQRGEHSVRRFADRNDEHASVRIQVAEIFTNSEYTAFAMHLPRECLSDAGFAKRVIEDVAGDFFHFSLSRHLGDGATQGTIGRARLPAVPFGAILISALAAAAIFCAR